MPTSGPFYTYSQLEQIWIDNGGSPAAAPIAAAIAMAESSGGAGSTNQDNNGSIDRGLWQINSIHGAQSTFDPNANARAAVAISSNGANWRPWTTYTSGAYQRYVQGNIAPTSAGVPASGNGGSVQLAAATSTSGTDPGACLLGFSTSGVSVPIIGNLGSVDFCFFSKTEARAMIGGMMLASGAVVALVAVVLLLREVPGLPKPPPIPLPGKGDAAGGGAAGAAEDVGEGAAGAASEAAEAAGAVVLA
jgi:hypothetical protein